MIMRDLRGNWGFDVMKRATKVEELAIELQWNNTLSLTREFINEPYDGRHFRCDFDCSGGYLDSLLETCSRDLFSYSEEFQIESLKYLTHPFTQFEGLEEND